MCPARLGSSPTGAAVVPTMCRPRPRTSPPPRPVCRRPAQPVPPGTYRRRCAEMTEIPTTMQAVVMHAPEDYRLEERPVPTPAADELLIRVEATGVCASDLKAYAGAAKFWGDENRDGWVEPGIIPGHEITGEVVTGSAEALAHHGVSVGDRIVVEQIVPCGECMYCDRGWYWMCAPHDMFGFKKFHGGMAEYMIVPSLAR